MEINEQLEIIRTSKKYVILLILGIALSLANLNAQENQLVCGEDPEGTGEIRERQLLSSVMVTAALFYFYELTGKTAQQANCESRSANNAYAASTLNLSAGLLRLTELLTRAESD